jgi:hypothetical protein
MKNLNSEQQIIDMLKKVKNQIEPSRRNFDKMISEIMNYQDVTKKESVRYIVNKDRPSIIINLINSMKYNWKVAVPSLVVILLAVFIGYQQFGKQEGNIAKKESSLDSVKEDVKNDASSQGSAKAILAQIDSEFALEEDIIGEEDLDLAMLSEDDQYFNELNNIYEK